MPTTIWPDRLEHLELLNPMLQDAGRNIVVDIVHSIRNDYAVPDDPSRIARATCALVDDYAGFMAENQHMIHPDSYFFHELTRRMRFAGFRYSTPVYGGEREMTGSELSRLVEQGYQLEGELPPDDGRCSVMEVESSVGIVVHAMRRGGKEGKMRVGARMVTCDRGLDEDAYTTPAETTYNGESFRLEKMHSLSFERRRPGIEVQVKRVLAGLRFSLNWSGVLTGTTPADAIATLEEQLQLLETQQVRNAALTAYVHTFLGASYLAAGNHDQAKQHYHAALSLHPDGNRLATARAFQRMGDHATAARLFGEAIAREDIGAGLSAVVPYVRALAEARRAA